MDKINKKLEYLLENSTSLRLREFEQSFKEFMVNDGPLLESKDLYRIFISQLKNIDDKDAVLESFIKKEDKSLNVHNLGVSNVLKSIMESSEYKNHPQITYAVQPFFEQKRQGLSDLLVAPKMIQSLAQYNWAPAIVEGVKILQEAVSNNHNEILLYEALLNVKAKNNSIYESLESELETAMYESFSKAELDSKIGEYRFLPEINRMLESYKTDAKEISSNQAVTVRKVFSPIAVNENKDDIFYVSNGGAFTIKNFMKRENATGKIGQISESEYKSLPGNFVDMVILMEKETVNVMSGQIDYYIRDRKVSIKIDEELNKVVECEGQILDAKNYITELSIMFPSMSMYESNTMREIQILVEGIDNVYELDNVHSLRSNFNDKLVVNVIEEGLSKDNVIITTSNSITGENIVQDFETITEAVNWVNENVSFDLSKYFDTNIANQELVNEAIDEMKKEHLAMITKLEGELNRVNTMLESDDLKTDEDLLEAKKLIEEKLDDMKAEWYDMNSSK